MAEILAIMGSDSDLPVVSAGFSILEEFGVTFETHFSSAHRSPAKTIELVEKFESSGGQVIIAAAGMSAHLAGVIAAHTTIPVIGLPLSSPDYAGLDSLLSMVEMPPGIPVGVMGKGKSGAKNAALYAVAMLSHCRPELKAKLRDYRQKLAAEVESKDERLQKNGWKNYAKE